MNLALISVPFLAVYLIGGRRGAPLAVLPAAFCALGIAQYFLSVFKYSAIRPSDVFALQTALSVSGGYSYEVGGNQVLALGLCVVAVAILSFVQPQNLFAEKGRRLRLVASGVRVACGAGVLVVAGLVLGEVSLSHDLGFSPSYWNSIYVYRNQGFVGSFVTIAQNSRVARPDGYTEGDAQDLLQEYVAMYQDEAQVTSARGDAERQFQETRPIVVAIMNESFSDLSIYEGLNAGYEGPSRLKSIEDALYAGYVYSSVLGGGTCNSEFEFLVGATMGFVGAENQPYVMNSFSNTPSLPSQFGEMGYSTSAIHPQVSSNWNRETVYEEMGFEHFLDINSFDASSPIRHAGVTDAVTYDKIIELIESDDSPQFIFDVTMQNHSGYDTFDLPEEERVDPGIGWAEEQLVSETTEYVSLIEASDRELSDFINRLRELDRPVIVAFFGDHQPALGSTFNNLIYSGEDQGDPAHSARVYQTPYMIWASYDVAGNDQVSERLDMGINSLAAVMLDSIGAPITDWQMAQVALLQEVPVINGYAYQTPDGRWHELGGDVADAVRDIEWIQYLEYASKL
ncbi:LTA synthase family protein [Thermophilibacter provencensis]|uniref:LTA synthase family protein n=1 Tax=Thermophilibacter provencensis TaxID=1852386 RepID=UPI003AA8567E